MPSLTLADFSAALTTRAAVGAIRARRAAGTSTRPPSIATRFVQDLRSDCDAQGMRGVALPLAPLARAWCEVSYPAQADRQTPWATLESQLRVAAKAGALPVDVVIVSAKDAAQVGLPASALIIILPLDTTDRGEARTHALLRAVDAQAQAVAARNAGAQS